MEKIAVATDTNSSITTKEAEELGIYLMKMPFTIDGEEFEFSQGFTELHNESYRRILAGEGFRISEARNCIQIVSDIRHATPIGLKGDYHPLAKLPLAPHPFGWEDMKY